MRSPTIAALLATLTLAACGSDASSPEAGIAGDGRLDVPLAHIRNVYALPALSAMMLFRGEILEAGSVGVRSLDFPDQATVEDEWLVGALTMSMTATLAGVLVEQGAIQWETTVGEVFPDLVGDIQPDFVSASIEDLLGHRSGLPSAFVTPVVETLYGSTDPLPAQRRAWIVELLSQEPLTSGQFVYSTGGYIVASAMLEEAAGAPWENLVQTEIFDPLGMTRAGFGPAWSEADAAQPHGHGAPGTGIDPADPNRFPLAMGPAGGVHLTMTDYALYLNAHIAGDQGEDGVLSADTFQKLHEPEPSTGYALGWGVVSRGWSPGGVLEHGGSLGGFNALVWVAPDIELALFAVTNSVAEQTPAAIDNTLQVLLQRFVAN